MEKNLEFCLHSGSLTENTPGDIHGWDVVPNGLTQMSRKVEPTRVVPTSSQAPRPSTSNPSSPHFRLHPQSHLLVLKERDSSPPIPE